MSADDSKLLAPAVNEEQKKAQANQASESLSDSEVSGSKVKNVRLPARTAIAGVLIHQFAHNELDGLGYDFISTERAPLPSGERSRI